MEIVRFTQPNQVGTDRIRNLLLMLPYRRGQREEYSPQCERHPDYPTYPCRFFPTKVPFISSNTWKPLCWDLYNIWYCIYTWYLHQWLEPKLSILYLRQSLLYGLVVRLCTNPIQWGILLLSYIQWGINKGNNPDHRCNFIPFHISKKCTSHMDFHKVLGHTTHYTMWTPSGRSEQ